MAVQWRPPPVLEKLGGTQSALLSHGFSRLSTNIHNIHHLEGQSRYVHIITHYINLGGMLCQSFHVKICGLYA